MERQGEVPPSERPDQVRRTSRLCLDLHLVVDTCERLDLPLQDAGRRAALAAAIRSLDTRTIHLFNSSLAEVPVDFPRENCHKLVLAGTAGKERDDLADVYRAADERYTVTLNKIFDEVPCLLGIWAADFDECTVDGLLICQDPKTFYAFRPHDPKAFWTLLTEKISDNLYTYINGIVKSITDSVTASSMNDFPNWGEHDLAVNAVKALAVFRTENIRLRLISRLTEAGGINRFGAVQS
ncbi:MAG: hypothetical protein GY823_04420 [Flavobacteriaceae bacterium]|nr:hypothetical protein [Flavobacteriaceae bacterium]